MARLEGEAEGLEGGALHLRSLHGNDLSSIPYGVFNDVIPYVSIYRKGHILRIVGNFLYK